MPEHDDNEPKLIIDTGWKDQAQAEKEKLAAQASERAEKSGGERELPPADVVGLVQLLATQALLYMGAFPDPQTGRAVVAMDLAKHHIDLLGTLEEKTKGNLSDEEEKIVSQTAHELRLQYVEVGKAVEKAIQEGRAQQIDTQGGMGGAGGISGMGGMGGMGGAGGMGGMGPQMDPGGTGRS